MFNDRFAQLLALHLSGEASPEDKEELHQLLKQHPEAHYFCETLTEYWTLPPQSGSDNIQEDIHFQQILAIAEERDNKEASPEPVIKARPAVFSLKFFLIAASFLAAVVSAAFIYYRPFRNQPVASNVSEVLVKAGARSYMLLPDGTKVWLNSESKLTYQGSFNGSIREVTLEGEAFFDVVKDKTRPFIVHTSDLDIKVLGTAFNVKSYPQEELIEATLIHGMIEVTNKNQPASPKVILKPHEKLVFNRSSAIGPQPVPANGERRIHNFKAPVISVTALPKTIADSAVTETSWKYNRLVFDNESFREIARRMERWYNVKINFRNEKAANSLIHVTFINETIEEALQALQLATPFTYSIKGSEIEILKK